MPMSEPLRVVLAEDNYLVREGTRQLLDATGEVVVVAAVGDGAALLTAVDEQAPAAVLTDIRMPPTHTMEGIHAAHEIRHRHPDIGVVVLSQHADEAYAFALLAQGTAGLGYLLKDRVGERAELVRALRETAGGRSVLDPVIVDALVGRRARQRSSPLARLTTRELDVLGAMAQGKTNAAIADSLSLSVSAVEKHSNAIFAKLGLGEEPQTHRRVAAVITFLRDAGAEDASGS
jgi:DNA-binding NarL/FixJ family response regulator